MPGPPSGGRDLSPPRSVSRGLRHDVIDDVVEAARPGEDPALAVRPGASSHGLLHEDRDLLPLISLFERLPDEGKELVDDRARGNGAGRVQVHESRADPGPGGA